MLAGRGLDRLRKYSSGIRRVSQTALVVIALIGRNLKLRVLGSDDVQKKSDDELFTIISKGMEKNRMPAFDRRLSKDQIHDLVEYIRSLKK